MVIKSFTNIIEDEGHKSYTNIVLEVLITNHHILEWRHETIVTNQKKLLKDSAYMTADK